MGIISGIKAMNAVAKLKKGETANLSIAQVTNLIINLPDAQNNLSPCEFKAILDLFNELNKCKTKMPQTIDTYNKTCIQIIKKFDAIAPYEKYSGGNQLEFSFLMEDIREVSDEPYTIDGQNDNKIVFDEEARTYLDYIVEHAPVQLNNDEAKAIVGIIYRSYEHEKNEVLKEFDILAQKTIEENEPIKAMMKISYMAGLLYPNEVLKKEETNELSKKYADQVTEMYVANADNN